MAYNIMRISMYGHDGLYDSVIQMVWCSASFASHEGFIDHEKVILYGSSESNDTLFVTACQEWISIFTTCCGG